MNRFDEEMIPYYQRYDDALMRGDKNEIKFLAQFCNEKDPDKWKGFQRRQICENMYHHDQMKRFGYTEIRLNDVGWYEWKFPGYEQQEFIRLGVEINRGACNMKDAKAVGILQVANGNWVADVGSDFTSIGTSVIYMGCNLKQYATRKEALNAALQEYIDRWTKHNPGEKKEDQAVSNARTLMAGGTVDLSEKPKRQAKPKAQPKAVIRPVTEISLAARLRAALLARLAA